MARQNANIYLDIDVRRKAQLIAAKNNSSFSRWVENLFISEIEKDLDNEKKKAHKRRK